MNFPFLFGEASAAVDPALTSLVTLLGTCGPTAGAIVVLWVCMDYLKGRDTRDREARAQDRAAAAEVNESLRALVAQQGEVMREFIARSNGICHYQVPSRRPPS